MRLEKVFMNIDLAIGSYRHAVGTLFPAMTRVAWQDKKQEIRKDDPSATRKTFLYNLSRSDYRKNWGDTYTKPGIRSKFLALVFRAVPKVGPWRALAFERLTPETEKMYMASVNSTIDAYRKLLLEQGAGRLKLPNVNLDVGVQTPPGKYTLADAAYAELLYKTAGHYPELSPELRSDLLAFYGNLSGPNSCKSNDKTWARVLKELDELRAADNDLRHPTVAAVDAPVSR
jgi:hypothetical protein